MSVDRIMLKTIQTLEAFIIVEGESDKFFASTYYYEDGHQEEKTFTNMTDFRKYLSSLGGFEGRQIPGELPLLPSPKEEIPLLLPASRAKKNRIEISRECAMEKWRSYSKKSKAWLISDMIGALEHERAKGKRITKKIPRMDEKNKPVHDKEGEPIFDKIDISNEEFIGLRLDMTESQVKNFIKDNRDEIEARKIERERLLSFKLDPNYEPEYTPEAMKEFEGQAIAKKKATSEKRAATREAKEASKEQMGMKVNAAIRQAIPQITKKQFEILSMPGKFPEYWAVQVNPKNYQVMEIKPVYPNKTGFDDEYQVTIYNVKGRIPNSIRTFEAAMKSAFVIEQGIAPKLKKARYWLYRRDPAWVNLSCCNEARNPKSWIFKIDEVTEYGFVLATHYKIFSKELFTRRQAYDNVKEWAKIMFKRPTRIEIVQKIGHGKNKKPKMDLDIEKIKIIITKIKKSKSMNVVEKLEHELIEHVQPLMDEYGLSSAQELLYDDEGHDARQWLIKQGIPANLFKFNKKSETKESKARYYHLRVRPPGKSWLYFTRNKKGDYFITKVKKGRQFSTLDVGSPGGLQFTVGFPRETGLKPGQKADPGLFRVQRVNVEINVLDLPENPTNKQIINAIKKKYSKDIKKMLQKEFGKEQEIKNISITSKKEGFNLKIEMA